MIAAIKDHQGKSRGIAAALQREGWQCVPVGPPADVLLIDHDIDRPGYRDVIDYYKANGAKIVLYPHGALPVCVWDGIIEPYPVDACLVIGTGHRDVMQAYGYPYPIHVIGWSFCEQRSFRSHPVEQVLFAPAHPLGNGYLHQRYVTANQRAYHSLLRWDVPLTVRHVGSLEMNGLWSVHGVIYERGMMDTTLGSIDDHDLVVARDTFLSLAVARGVPAITFHQAPMTSDPEGPDEPEITVQNWDAYGSMLRYPYDLTDSYGRATSGWWPEMISWRERFVGSQLDSRTLSSVLQDLIESGTVAAVS